jgi:hypothetical protein
VLAEDPRIVMAAFVAETFGRSMYEVLQYPRERWRIELAGAMARANASRSDPPATPTEGASDA